jgi:hypothetical protein
MDAIPTTADPINEIATATAALGVLRNVRLRRYAPEVPSREWIMMSSPKVEAS